MNKEILVSREYIIDFKKSIQINIYKPVVDQEYSKSHGITYRADFDVGEFNHNYMTKAYGLDELQAIYLAFLTIGNMLYSSSEYADGRLTFNGCFDLQLPCSEGIKKLFNSQPKGILNSKSRLLALTN